jgi:hypothetical protein
MPQNTSPILGPQCCPPLVRPHAYHLHIKAWTLNHMQRADFGPCLWPERTLYLALPGACHPDVLHLPAHALLWCALWTEYASDVGHGLEGAAALEECMHLEHPPAFPRTASRS